MVVSERELIRFVLEWSVSVATYGNGRGLVNDHELGVHVHHGDMVRCHGYFMPVINGKTGPTTTSQSDTTRTDKTQNTRLYLIQKSRCSEFLPLCTSLLENFVTQRGKKGV
jgi:hypothetical protein